MENKKHLSSLPENTRRTFSINIDVDNNGFGIINLSCDNGENHQVKSLTYDMMIKEIEKFINYNLYK